MFSKIFFLMVGIMLIGGFFVAVAEYDFASAQVDTGTSKKGEHNMSHNRLTLEEERVIVNKGTERPYSGKYYKHDENGIYTCKRCNAKLFESGSKFDANCGWPSFDDAIEGAVIEKPDADGVRVEIVCASCEGHLGHVFKGEGFTAKNIRHCVNSVSLGFESENKVEKKMPEKTETAYFAGGCFWGVEYYLEKEEGVISAVSGYMGGNKQSPTYEDVCSGKTGHAETVKVVFDPEVTNYEKLARMFFEIHDPTQLNHQGPDMGTQYRSAIYYISDAQRAVVERLMAELREKGFKVVTELEAAGQFFEAEEYHQDYYDKTRKTPYCHSRVNRF